MISRACSPFRQACGRSHEHLLTSKAAARLSGQFSSHGAIKTYLAVAEGNAPGGELEGFNIKGRGYRFQRPCAGKHLRRKVRPVLPTPPSRTERAGTPVRVSLHTGRHHQIRVQLAGAGYPLGATSAASRDARPGQQIALWACSLEIEHPTLHTRLRFTSTPSGGVWKDFSDILPAAVQGIGIAYIDHNIIAAVKPQGACRPPRPTAKGIPWRPGSPPPMGRLIPPTAWT